MTSEHNHVRTYGGWRRSRGIGLLGLGPAATPVLLGGLITVLIIAALSIRTLLYSPPPALLIATVALVRPRPPPPRPRRGAPRPAPPPHGARHPAPARGNSPRRRSRRRHARQRHLRPRQIPGQPALDHRRGRRDRPVPRWPGIRARLLRP